MELGEVKTAYRDLLQPVFGELFRMDDSEEERNWIVIILDGKQEDFYLSLYGTDCVRLYWCNECFIFSKRRHDLVSSDTYGEIVFEGHFDAEDLPRLITGLILLVFVNRKSHVNPYIVVLQCGDGEAEAQARALLEASTRRCAVKSKTVREGLVELNLDVRLRDGDTGFVNALAGLEGVRSAVLVSYNGDYLG